MDFLGIVQNAERKKENFIFNGVMYMSLEERHVLAEEEQVVLEDLKKMLGFGINFLVSNGVRKANIEIELVSHIRSLLY